MILKPKYTVKGEISPFDERDNVQSRGGLKPGSPEYTEYYKQHSELENRDRLTREMAGKYIGNPKDFMFFVSLIENLHRMGMERYC